MYARCTSLPGGEQPTGMDMAYEQGTGRQGGEQRGEQGLMCCTDEYTESTCGIDWF